MISMIHWLVSTEWHPYHWYSTSGWLDIGVSFLFWLLFLRPFLTSSDSMFFGLFGTSAILAIQQLVSELPSYV